ncbi:hypothetical protein cyc_06336 [Cyclospora cayetanensis]|uniref:Uncharacterized protein n=1 Tax=Cyclospora cayetanensis TaxID=88456 RepID=A0A1D3CUC8_9EIME|nr:hypothetical protein cyc_06336 [Cyclospora cayetanensis]
MPVSSPTLHFGSMPSFLMNYSSGRQRSTVDAARFPRILSPPLSTACAGAGRSTSSASARQLQQHQGGSTSSAVAEVPPTAADSPPLPSPPRNRSSNCHRSRRITRALRLLEALDDA